MIPSQRISAADYNSVSQGTSLLPTRCLGGCCGAGEGHGEFKMGLEFVSLSLPEAPAGRDLSPNNASPSTKKKKKKRKSGDAERFAGAYPGLWTRKDPQTS